jgi:hypothetical protein
MRTKIALLSCLAGLGALLPGAAWAEDAPPAPAPAPEPAPTPPSAPAAPAAGTSGMTAAPDAAPAPAPPAAGPAAWPGWMRIDSDGGGLQLWAGSTAPLTDGIGLAFDAYVFQGAASFGEFDIGPAFAAGGLTLTPMLGVQMDWSNRTFAALVPQFYVTGSVGPIYTELWLQYYNYKSIYKYTEKVGLANSYFYARLFADYKISDYVAVGPQIELTNDFEVKKLISLPVGANVFLSNTGAASTFQFFVGYETKKGFGPITDPATNAHLDGHFAGRLSFVHNF